MMSENIELHSHVELLHREDVIFFCFCLLGSKRIIICCRLITCSKHFTVHTNSDMHVPFINKMIVLLITVTMYFNF